MFCLLFVSGCKVSQALQVTSSSSFEVFSFSSFQVITKLTELLSSNITFCLHHTLFQCSILINPSVTNSRCFSVHYISNYFNINFCVLYHFCICGIILSICCSPHEIFLCNIIVLKCCLSNSLTYPSCTS